MKILLFCLMIFAAQIVDGFGQTASTSSSIKGIVKDSNGAVITGARVSLQGAGAREFVSFTDSDGNFSFENLPDGEYRLQVSAEGFAGMDRRVESGTGS